MKPIRVCMLVRNDVRTDYRVLKEATSLARAGYEVTVVGANTYGPAKRETRNGFEILLVPVEKSTNRLGKAINLLPKMMWRMVKVAKSLNAHVYHAHDSDTILPAWLAARSVAQASLLYDAHEVGFIPSGFASLQEQIQQYSLPVGVVNWLWNRLNDHIVRRHAKIVITVNEILAQMQAQHYGTQLSKVVMNCPPQASGHSQEYETLHCYLKIAANTPIIICHGMYSVSRGDEPGLENLIRSAPLLAQGIVVLIGNVGVAEEFSRLRQLAAQPEFAGKVFILPMMPPEKLLAYTHNAAIGMITLQLRPPLHLASPNKFFEYLAASLPVITSDLPAVRYICEEYACGIIYDPSSPQSTAAAINHVLGDRGLYQQLQSGAQKAATVYNWEHQEQTLLEIYRDLIGTPERDPS